MGSSPVPGWVTNPVIVCGHRTSDNVGSLKVLQGGLQDHRHSNLLRERTQCGFASDANGNPLSEEDQERKLVLVSNVADEVWG
jgi:hypothetical protein